MTPADTLTHDGITQPVSEWALDYGIPARLIILRIGRGMSPTDAITKPMQAHRDRKLADGFATAAPKPRPDRTPKKAMRYCHAGQSLTLGEWSELLGVPVSTLRNRLSVGRPPDVVFSTRRPPNPLKGVTPENAKRITHAGKTLTMKQWAALTGVPLSSLCQRLARGEPMAQALDTGRARNRRYEHDGQSHTLPEWARLHGINLSTLRARITRLGFPIGDALTWRAKSKRPMPRRMRLSTPRNAVCITIAGMPVDIDPQCRGVVINFEASKGTGGGSVAQDSAQIDFSTDEASR